MLTPGPETPTVILRKDQALQLIDEVLLIKEGEVITPENIRILLHAIANMCMPERSTLILYPSHDRYNLRVILRNIVGNYLED